MVQEVTGLQGLDSWPKTTGTSPLLLSKGSRRTAALASGQHPTGTP